MTLAPRWILNGLDLTAEPFLVEMNGSDHGAPESIRSILASMLVDGDIDLIDRHGNRVYAIPVLLEGALDELAAAEAVLVSAVSPERGTLVVEPGDASAPASVFETFAGELVLEKNEDADDQGLRRAKLTIPCRPFARAEALSTIDAPAVLGSTTTVVDDGSSASGWALLGDSTVAPDPHRNLIDPDAWGDSGGTASLSGNSSDYPGVAWVPSGVGNAHIRSNQMTVTPGEKYRIDSTFAVNDAGKTRTMGVLYRWYKADGVTQVGTDVRVTASVSSPNWLPKWWEITAPSTAVKLTIYLYVVAKSTSDDVSAVHVSVRKAAEKPQGYFDGAGTDTAAATYSWDAGAGTSTATLTWSSPTLAVASGAVRGTVFGRTYAEIRRTGAIDLSTLNYLRIKGTATAAADGLISIADNGAAVVPIAYSYNPSTGAFDIVIERASGFTTVDVAFGRDLASSIPSTSVGTFVAVDAIEKTDNPFGTGKVQSRQVQIFGSQRTELSLAVLGLDAAGATPVGLGEQVLVHTAAKGGDGRSKFLACRATSGVGGTSDSTAVSGAYNTLGATGSPTSFTFAAGTLLTGNYLAVGRVRMTAPGSSELSLRAFIDPTVGDNIYDPPTGWRTAPLTCVASGAVWPQVNDDAWVMLPLGLLRLPPADIEDTAATVTIQVARGSTAVALDEVFLLNADVGQASLILTGLSSGSFSAVRLDAATVDAPQASAWVGAAGGTMVADLARWVGEQHAAEPGSLQIATVTPGCATSRVSASYYRRYHTHVVDEGA